MCTGLEAPAASTIIAGIGAGAAAAGTYQGYQASKEAKRQAQRAEADRKKAEAEANSAASFKTAQARQALRANSLFTGGGTAGAAPGTSSGQTTLGVGG